MNQVPEGAVHYQEIVTPDVAAVRAYHERVLGLRFERIDALGGAMVASRADGSRLGIRAPLRADEAPVTRSYVRVPDLAAAVKRAGELGAEIAIDRMEIAGLGTIAIVLHGGLEHGLWQLP